MKQALNKLSDNQYLELAARWFLALTFLYACHSKIWEPAQFAKTIYGYALFPDISINLIAIIIPWLELAAAASLIFGIYPRSGALLISGMLLFYMIAISINLIRGHEFDCGCFSPSGEGQASAPEMLLIRDVGYFILGLFVLFYSERRMLCLRQTGGLFRKDA